MFAFFFFLFIFLKLQALHEVNPNLGKIFVLSQDYFIWKKNFFHVLFFSDFLFSKKYLATPWWHGMFLLDRPPPPPLLAGRVLWNRVCLSFCPSFGLSFPLSRHFLGIVSLVFSKFWHDARNPYEVTCGRGRFPRKTILCMLIQIHIN